MPPPSLERRFRTPPSERRGAIFRREIFLPPPPTPSSLSGRRTQSGCSCSWGRDSGKRLTRDILRPPGIPAGARPAPESHEEEESRPQEHEHRDCIRGEESLDGVGEGGKKISRRKIPPRLSEGGVRNRRSKDGGGIEQPGKNQRPVDQKNGKRYF